MFKGTGSRWLTCLCILILLAVPVLVRIPTAVFPGMTAEERAVYADENGDWYLTDMDSYYHVRAVDNHLANGHPGNTRLEDGTAWDSLRFWPEGRAADYAPGIILWTEAVWKPLNALFGVRLRDVEFCLAAAMSALTALAAFLLGRRMSNRIGGLAAAILVSCAPAFVQRTGFGRYDTDMFVLLMELLLILFLSEALRAKTIKICLCFSAAFILTALVYSLCWTAEAVIMVTGLTVLGGAVSAVWNALDSRNRKKEGKDQSLIRPLAAALGSGAAVLLLFLLIYGPGIVGSLFSYASLTSDYTTASGVLPNEYMPIAELNAPSFFPREAGQWLADLSGGGGLSVMTGVGGIVPLLLCLFALGCLALRSIRRMKRTDVFPLDASGSRVYGCILLVLCAGWLFLVRYGNRFTEHLAVPVCLAAGAAVGWAAERILRRGVKRALSAGLAAVLCLCAVVPSIADSVGIMNGFRPTISRVSEDAMAWIRENAEDPEAVIVSWWDNGYYYEHASGHPCLWDGGSVDAVRAVLVSRALTAEDPGLSSRILLMLASSGNTAAEFLMEKTDAGTAFRAMEKALTAEPEAARTCLREECGLTDDEADETERLLHPAEPKETYLVLTDAMMMQYGWFEYYGFWDFTGNTPEPLNTSYDFTPTGYHIERPEARKYMEETRTRETLWRIYLQAEENDRMTCVYRGDDGLEHVRIWRIE